MLAGGAAPFAAVPPLVAGPPALDRSAAAVGPEAEADAEAGTEAVAEAGAGAEAVEDAVAEADVEAAGHEASF